MRFKSILLILIVIFSGCGNEDTSRPEDTCLKIWIAMASLDMETIKELSTEDSQGSLSILHGTLKNQGFYYFARTLGVMMETQDLSGIANENSFECEVLESGEARCYFRQPGGGMLNKKHHWKFRKEDGRYKFVVGMYLLF